MTAIDHRTRRFAQRGDGKLGCIIWTALLVIGAMICWKAIPPKIASAELYDYMVEQAKFAAKQNPATLKRWIVEKAQQLDIPLDPKNVTVTKAGGRIKMRAYYVVTLDFPGYKYDWEFDLQVNRPIFIV